MIWLSAWFALSLDAICAEGPWSLRPLTKPPLPAASTHPLDAFVDARLATQNHKRAPRSDRRTLIRRLTFGLTGLPPTQAEAATFTVDNDPQAYPKLIDRLLASPRYGEHWARHWLDVAQYADTHGNDHDYRRPNAWPYRDYVIKAFNEDKPYARFVQEQIAGDALFPASPDATIALGFLAAGPWDDTLMITIRPDTIDHRMGQNLDRDSMVSAAMGTFQSLTVHCARCHDHKFDPVSQKEYYALQAVFAGCDRADRPVDSDPAIHAKRAELRELQLALKRGDPSPFRNFKSLDPTSKIAALEKEAEKLPTWTMLEIRSVGSSEAPGETVFTKQDDHSWFVSGKRPGTDTFVVAARSDLKKLSALKLEVLPDERLPVGGPGRYDNGNFHLAEFRATASQADTPGAKAFELQFAGVVADHSDGGDRVANALDGNPASYWSINPHYNKAHQAIFALKAPLQHGLALTIKLQFTGKDGHQIGRFRLWGTADTLGSGGGLSRILPEDIRELLDIPAEKRTPVQRRLLALRVLEEDLSRQLATLPAPSQLVYAITHDFKKENGFEPALTPRPIHVLHRGELSDPGELVGPGALSCIPGLPAALTIDSEIDEAARRAALARWITDKRNVLTWRSIVNRVWHWHFGQGLCATPNDFGVMGAKPSHPELLDWLALWFRDEAKGSLKELHRLILTSETYAQQVLDDASSPVARDDADNRLLWRMNRQRLTAEQVRDAVLHLSGQLDLKMGGSPALHFLHQGDKTFKNSAPPFVDYLNFDRDSPDNKRRAIYRFIFRTVPDPLMDALGCPDGGGAVPVRSSSSTAQQALAMLNDAFLIHQSEQIANRLSTENKNADSEQLARAAFLLFFQRPPSEEERNAVASYINKHGLANACHLLLNSNEFLFLD